MKKIGFTGPGDMGGATAENLAVAGLEVRGYDPAPAASEVFERGAGITP